MNISLWLLCLLLSGKILQSLKQEGDENENTRQTMTAQYSGVFGSRQSKFGLLGKQK